MDLINFSSGWMAAGSRTGLYVIAHNIIRSDFQAEFCLSLNVGAVFSPAPAEDKKQASLNTEH